MNKSDTNTMIDRKQLAARWNISIPTLKRMEARGELQPVAISERIIRYNLEAIERIEGTVNAGQAN